ncbi:MAG: response regulator, partial [Verrucomicrobiota bacterium]
LGNSELVLLVDDEEAIREVARRSLERFGYRVVTASHGAEALSEYFRRQSEIAGVITDMAMPIIDGPALIVALKSINPEVRIIGSSGLTSNDGVAKAVGAGVQHFIPKPYTAEAMLNTLYLVLQGQPLRV